MSALNKVLELLRDGKWHSLKEIKKEAGFQGDKLEKTLGFFAEYKFIQLDKQRKRVKLTSSALGLLTKTQQINLEG